MLLIDVIENINVKNFVSSASFWLPDSLVESAWIEHAPFAFWLVGEHRPRVLVELGTHRGYSYLAFNQAVKRLGTETRCFAVDTWKGDEHSGFYGPEVLERLREYHNCRYGAFSQLVPLTFDEAVGSFQDATIDLLHIDGRHFYEDVKHDFDTWRPKLSNRAVVLFHDICVREKGFGVFRLWEELRAQYPHFEFIHGEGLGILGIGKALPDTISALFAASTDPNLANGIREVYNRLGSALTDQFWKADAQRLFSKLAEKTAEGQRLEMELAKSAAERQQLQTELSQSAAERQQLQTELSQSAAERQQLQTELSKSAAERQQLQIDLSQSATERQQCQQELTRKLDEKIAEGERLEMELAKSAAERQQLQTDLSRSATERKQGEQELAREKSENERLMAELANSTAERQMLETELARRTAECKVQLTQRAAESGRLATKAAEHERLQAELAEHVAERERMRSELTVRNAQIEGILSSTSWRLTSPLRAMGRRMPWLKKRLGLAK